MESGDKTEVRRLCREVSQEDDNSDRMQNLLDQLLQVLEERQLTSLLL